MALEHMKREGRADFLMEHLDREGKRWPKLGGLERESHPNVWEQNGKRWEHEYALPLPLCPPLCVCDRERI